MCNRYFIQPKLNLLVAHNPTGRSNIQSNAFLLSTTAIDSMGFVNDDQECGLHRIVFTIENKFETMHSNHANNGKSN